MRIALIMAVILLGTGGLAYGKCIPPSGDTFDKIKPTVIGEVVSYQPDQKSLMIYVNGKNRSVSTAAMKASDFFTSYGGITTLERVSAGSKVEIWTKDCKPPKGDFIEAAVIRVLK
jgi:hypothetical protein